MTPYVRLGRGSITFSFLAFHSAFPKMEIAMLVQHVDLLSIADLVDAVDLCSLISPLFLVACRGCSCSALIVCVR